VSVSFRENDVQALLTSLIEALGQPVGEGGRSPEAYRQAARLLAASGVAPEALDKLLRDFAVASLRESGLAVTLGFATPSAP